MLDFDVKFLKGVGPNRALKLNRLGVYTVEDLLNYFPVKYEDRRVVKKINELKDEKKVLLKIKICDYPKKARIKKNMTIIKALATDGTGFIHLTFFNQDHLINNLSLSEFYYIFGVVKSNYGKFEMINPEIELVANATKAGRIMPIYSLTYNLTNNEITKIVKVALEYYFEKIDSIIPEYIRKDYNLILRKDAIRYLHFPTNGKKYTIAKKTIAFEKLLIMQIGLLSIKSKLVASLDGIQIKNAKLADMLLNSLPFKLTDAQYRVINEIKCDMAKSKPMNRLVQGDVGSGKTIIAIYAMLIAVKSGFQSSMMAPTEILAMQHYDTIKEYVKLSNIEINIEFLSGSTKTKQKNDILNKLRNGEIDILIGTHALIEDNVEFNNIGLVVTDEQHRFGVRQRALLSNKGMNPDILVMTATPIPRTLALMLYGDLDISIIDELPPGRQKIKTYVVKENQKIEMYNFIDEKVREGNQAYIVAPLVDESDNLELDSAREIYEELATTYFSKYKLGILYGSMKNSEKERVINDFYKGEINILVSTTVIEVGVNVPNAVIMMILNAERFGLAQLHQLRGRVGRGKTQSYCILVNESKSKKSKDRMNILVKTNDGFLVSEEDLKIRGPGDFFGTAQHGLSKYDVQNIINDIDVVQDVSILSKKILSENPNLDGAEYINLKKHIINLFKDENIIFN
ncbi:ATP-dependent DNA helicase RecG [Sedimentibacter acidaminivorans]|uniref:ATP-dependent DNA helicase RecG n=1 Tax=Sedimentibacter acidaminivorans TaxID=913099 RepID=A0ABS4GB04_9FIRM|nr:ATP-dependent DNA helicase RecG [Sedimentibacter acidaminivorans]MBP1924861.1 ATP-dependent DNA helicase RecG [Sedimentibacter acidaminivorans]